MFSILDEFCSFEVVLILCNQYMISLFSYLGNQNCLLNVATAYISASLAMCFFCFCFLLEGDRWGLGGSPNVPIVS